MHAMQCLASGGPVCRGPAAGRPCPPRPRSLPRPARHGPGPPVGFTRARAEIPLVAEATGKVLRVMADVGQPVGANGVFAQVDPTFIELDLRDNAVQRGRLRERMAYDETEAGRYRRLVGQGNAAQARLDELEQALSQSRHELAALEVARDVLAERLRARGSRPRRGGSSRPARWSPGSGSPRARSLAGSGTSTPCWCLRPEPEQFAALRGAADGLTLALPEAGGPGAGHGPPRLPRVRPRNPQDRRGSGRRRPARRARRAARGTDPGGARPRRGRAAAARRRHRALRAALGPPRRRHAGSGGAAGQPRRPGGRPAARGFAPVAPASAFRPAAQE